jgi:murein L,D-transpeptidase YcbB/YkuD
MSQEQAALENKKNHGSVFDVSELPIPFLGTPANSLRLVRMVEVLQEMHGLPVTGIIDSLTVECMSKPVPDPPKKTKKKPSKKQKSVSSQDPAIDADEAPGGSCD